MIRIGLAGWGDQDELYEAGTPAREKLKRYARHFPVVEVDSSFYALQAPETFARWERETPREFGFLVKAYQGMTGHLRGKQPFADDLDGVFRDFAASVRPLEEAGKLFAVLMQYPPWFDCTRPNVEALRQAKRRLGDLPAALEFRHQSWFAPGMRERTLAFMAEEGWIHSICDEPQAGPGSVPTVLRPTHASRTVVRMHGRNEAGWNQTGGGANWREVRYLYQYNEEELALWRTQLMKQQEETEHICVIFNNNSGGHAAGNAKQLMRLLGMPVSADPPRQLDLFE